MVYLVGTAHVSRQSAEDVRRVIQAVRPQNVVVELCSSRTAIMYDEGGTIARSDRENSSRSEDDSGTADQFRANRDADASVAHRTLGSDSAAEAWAERQASGAAASGSGRQGLASNLLALR